MMLYNLKHTIRRIIKDSISSGFSLFGLTIGILSFLILIIHVLNEKSFDKHINDSQDIYRVHSVVELNLSTPWARSLGFVHEVASDMPEILERTQFSYCDMGMIKIDEHEYQQENLLSVDMGFISMFSVESIVGDLKELNKPNTLFISERVAKKYFKDENPIGKSIEIKALQYYRNLGKYEIKGVVKNSHPKSHFVYDILLSQKGGLSERYRTLPDSKVQWTYNYVKLRSGADPKLIADKIDGKFKASNLINTRGPKKYAFSLMPMEDIHLKSECKFELKKSSCKLNIGMFIIIALVILFVSVLNFVNLTIAKVINRAKEFRLKKSIGAKSLQVINQVLTEVLIFSLLSILISVMLIEILKPYINSFFDIEFDVFYSEPVVYLCLVCVLLFCLLLSALFTVSFVTRRVSTTDIFNSKLNESGGRSLKYLLIGQIAIVVMLMTGTILVNKQIHFILNKPLGFSKENVLVLHLKNYSKDPAVFAEALRKQSRVESVGFASQHFGYPTQSYNLEYFNISGYADLVFVNYDYLKTMDIKMIHSWIKPEADTVEGMVINNHLYKRLMDKHGSKEALDVYMANQTSTPDQFRVKIIGVAQDFNYNSAHQSIGDYSFLLGESRRRARFIHIRLKSGNLKESMDVVKRVWKTHYANDDFKYFFIDDKVTQQYKSEAILSRFLTTFSLIGILISIIGISALSLFMSQKRTKEIGIRKVNGANTSEILSMLNLDFIKLSIVSIAIALPFSYYSTTVWLENFAYKTSLSWWVFVLPAIIAVLIVLSVVNIQSWRSASRNPVKALRYE